MKDKPNNQKGDYVFYIGMCDYKDGKWKVPDNPQHILPFVVRGSKLDTRVGQDAACFRFMESFAEHEPSKDHLMVKQFTEFLKERPKTGIITK